MPANYRPDPSVIVKVTGTSISFHFPGFHCQRLSAYVAEASSMSTRVDWMTATLVTEPVIRSSVSRNKPDPARCPDHHLTSTAMAIVAADIV
jgi:hypothetical protein